MGNHMMKLVSGGNKKNARKSSAKSHKKQRALDDELLQHQMLAVALQQQQQKSMRLDRAVSQRNNSLAGGGASVPEKLPRSSSSRPRSVSDPIMKPHQLINGKIGDELQNLETKHFVLVHGGGYGAWCWYKSIALLEESGFTATAIELTGSGIDYTDPNTITTMALYIKPLISFLEKLPDNEKVILVGHDFGGACISYAMELFSEKITKAIFIAAAMISNGQRPSDIFANELMTADDLLPKAQQFIYANGNTNFPTALEFDKAFLRDLFFNQSPARDVALATVSMRPIPFAPTLERLSLSDEKYGRVRRFYIETTEDMALTPALQHRILTVNPPEKSYTLKGADHSPFLSKPQTLHRLFIEISQEQLP